MRLLGFDSPWGNNNNFKRYDRGNNNGIFDGMKGFKMPNLDSGSTNSIIYLILILIGIWCASGIYIVQEGEQAAVVRFGKFVKIAHPGLNYHLPSPVENVFVEKVNQSRRIEIGYRSGGSKSEGGIRPIQNESVMLTGDENIVELNCDITWHISNVKDYVFSTVNPDETVKMSSESAIREVIGKATISSILSNQKQEIADKVAALAQKILDQYEIGVQIDQVQLLKSEPPYEVIESYRDVQASKADKESAINQAMSYNNDIIPKARGEAAKIIQEAEGYRFEVVSKAQGEVSRFNAIHSEYVRQKELTETRLYADVLEKILTNSKKYIVGKGTSTYFPLQNAHDLQASQAPLPMFSENHSSKSSVATATATEAPSSVNVKKVSPH